ncbi:MAG: PKD domain-containing protein [Polyangiaceae bacterium]
MSLSRTLMPLLFALVACGDDPARGGAGGTGGEGGFGGAGGDEEPPPTHKPPSNGGNGGSENRPPFAFAGQDMVVAPGTEIMLDGSQSYDPEGFILLYRWWISSLGEFNDTEEPTLTFTAPMLAGDYQVSLTVTDVANLTATDSMNIHVKSLPTAHAGPDRSGLAGDVVALQGMVSEPDGDAVDITWTQVSGPSIPLSDPTVAAPSLVLPADLTEPLVYRLDASDVDGSAAPDWVTVVLLDGPDTDGDFLSDAKEASLGTDPASPDTDHDGIPDSWEIGRHDLVDYAALGCNPLHRDVLVEVDYQPTVQPGAVLLDAWAQHYAGLPIDNPDGTTGLTVHFVLDSVLPDDFVCGAIFTPGDVDDNPAYFDAFHTLYICVGGGFGVSELTGKHSYISAMPANDDPADDLDEEAVYQFYWLGLHELGHSLGLHHGGSDAINYKPNYPSYMNYIFDMSLSGTATSIATSDIALSSGARPPIDECALVEGGAWASVPTDESAYLASYTPEGWFVSPNGDIDWDRDGVIDETPYELVVRSATSDASHNEPGCMLLLDTDDPARIATMMAGALASNPIPPAPNAIVVDRWVP